MLIYLAIPPLKSSFLLAFCKKLVCHMDNIHGARICARDHLMVDEMKAKNRLSGRAGCRLWMFVEKPDIISPIVCV